MVARVFTVAFHGIEARLVEVQCAFSPGLPHFQIVGLPDKAVSEAKERVKATLSGLALALPSRRITVNLSPADLPKEGSHFDLPIALAVLACMGVLPRDQVESLVALGELSLDGALIAVNGALPAALSAAEEGLGFLCPQSCGPEAAWVDAVQVIAPATLLDAMNHFNGKAVLPAAEPGEIVVDADARDLADVKGQERAKRALEIAAAGRHHLMLVGEPGAGKSMMASRLPSILPPMTPTEALNTSMIHSLAGVLEEGGISRMRPYRDPHHTASPASIIGGGTRAKPGEVSLAHNGVLFLDELPEFPSRVLETLRQPLETGTIMVSRANAHVRYPCRFMLIAAANPCRCGFMTDPERACARAPLCGQDYLGRISGPLLDRFDLRIEVPPVAVQELAMQPSGEPSAQIAARVATARNIQAKRYEDCDAVDLNADAEGEVLEAVATPDAAGVALLQRVTEKFRLSARGYHRVLRVARTIADLDSAERVLQHHVAEAVSYRLTTAGS